MTRQIHYGTRARLGVILPSGNQAAEPQFAAMLPPGVSLHVTRLSLTGVSERDLLAMATHVEQAAVLVADVHPDLILFHCTAVSTYSAELEMSIIERIAHASGRPVTATSQAIVAALQSLAATKIVMLSPYPDDINRREALFLEQAGFEVLSYAGLACADVYAMMALPASEWMSFTLRHRNPDADAYLISCTAVRSAEVVEQLEQSLGKPVITSNTAAMWHCLRLSGVTDVTEGFGRLFAA